MVNQLIVYTDQANEDSANNQNHNGLIAFTQSGITMRSLATAGPAYQTGLRVINQTMTFAQ